VPNDESIPRPGTAHPKKETLHFLDRVKLEIEQHENHLVFKPFECTGSASTTLALPRSRSPLLRVYQVICVCLFKRGQELVKGQQSQPCKTLENGRVLFQRNETYHAELPEMRFVPSYNISLIPVNSNRFGGYAIEREKPEKKEGDSFFLSRPFRLI
jgi:hypothetical protein